MSRRSHGDTPYQTREKESANHQVIAYYFDVNKCRAYSRREGCYKEGAKTKSYSVIIKSDEHQRQLTFQSTDEFKAKFRTRYKIEAKNTKLKQVFGYNKALSNRISCMQLQGAMVIFAANIKRILKLI